MPADERDWRWANFPIPEAHLIVAAAGLLLGWIWPMTLGWDGPWRWVIGIVLIVVAVGLMIWATVAAGRVRLADPEQLVIGGPYRFSRHPMYLAWTVLYIGLLLILDSKWMLILLPILAIWVNREVTLEERRMVERFGDSYVDYQGRVRRYL